VEGQSQKKKKERQKEREEKERREERERERERERETETETETDRDRQRRYNRQSRATHKARHVADDGTSLRQLFLLLCTASKVHRGDVAVDGPARTIYAGAYVREKAVQA